jgi:hypothetical protein
MRMLLEKTGFFLGGIFFYFIVPSDDIAKPSFYRELAVFSNLLHMLIVVFSGSNRFDFSSVGPVFSCSL